MVTMVSEFWGQPPTSNNMILQMVPGIPMKRPFAIGLYSARLPPAEPSAEWELEPRKQGLGRAIEKKGIILQQTGWIYNKHIYIYIYRYIYIDIYIYIHIYIYRL